jgi:hypothetical protein
VTALCVENDEEPRDAGMVRRLLEPLGYSTAWQQCQQPSRNIMSLIDLISTAPVTVRKNHRSHLNVAGCITCNGQLHLHTDTAHQTKPNQTGTGML